MENNKVVKLYPITKFYLALVLVIASLIYPNIIFKVCLFIIINILALASGIWIIFIKRVKNSVAVLFVVLLLIQTFFYPGKHIMFKIGVLTATQEGLTFALRLGSTLLCIGGSLIWFFAITKEKDFVLALEKQGMSRKAAYVVLSTLQMIPILKQKSQIIMNAQKARGVETEGNLIVRAKVFIPTIIPLVLGAIAGIEERALTLEARGFSSTTKSTHLYDIHWSSLDKIILIGATILLLGLITGRILIWLI